MKKIVYILFAFILFSSCQPDEDAFFGAGISFYPGVILEAAEEDGVTYEIALESTGQIEGTGVVEIEVSNSDFLYTTPALNGNTITLELVDTNTATIEVTVLNDTWPTDYTSVFKIVGVSGALSGIGTGELVLMVEDRDTAPLFEDDFESGLGQWTIYDGGGGNTWGTATYDGDTYALASLYNSDNAEIEDDWLISDEIDFDTYDSETFSFRSKNRYNDYDNKLEVYVLTAYTSGNPSLTPLIKLSPALDTHEGSGYGTYTESGDIDLSGIIGTGRIAFRFKAVNASDASGWEVDDVLISVFDPDYSSENTGSGSGSGSDGPGAPTSSSVIELEEDFESGEIPSEWTAVSISGDNSYFITDYNENFYAAITGHGGSGSEEDWLVTPSVDIDGTEAISFGIEQAYATHEGLSIWYSTDFDGSDVAGASWINLNISIPIGDTEGFEGSFTTYSAYLDGLSAGTYYFAFKYVGGTTGTLTGRYHIDDVAVFVP